MGRRYWDYSRSWIEGSSEGLVVNAVSFGEDYEWRAEGMGLGRVSVLDAHSRCCVSLRPAIRIARPTLGLADLSLGLQRRLIANDMNFHW